MMRETKKRVSQLTVAGAFLILTSCGDSDGGTPTTPQAPVRNVIAQGEYQVHDVTGTQAPAPGGGAVGPCTAVFFTPFGWTGEPGTLDVLVRWGADRNDINIMVVRGTFPNACNCNLLLRTTVCENNAAGGFETGVSTSTNKPEHLTIPNLSSGAFTLVIWNQGPLPDEGTYEIGLTQ